MRSCLFVIIFIFSIISINVVSCSHSEIIDVIDDNTYVESPCEDGIIYFNRDIFTIINKNCAYSGCHDSSSKSDGVILDSYDNIINTANVIAYDPSDSKLYEVLIEDNLNKIMPPNGKLDDSEINLIYNWIDNGAKNINCDF